MNWDSQEGQNKISQYINNLKSQGGNWQQKAHQAAAKHGVSLGQIDNAMGWGSGTSQNWVANNYFNGSGNTNNTGGFNGGNAGNTNNGATTTMPSSHNGTTTTSNWDSSQNGKKPLQINFTPPRENTPPPVPTDNFGATPDNTVYNTHQQSQQTTTHVTPDNYIPETRDVDDKGLLANQIPEWLDPDSDVMKRLKTMSRQNSNASGLLNSSMANRDALSAMLDKAGEFAQFDATQFTNRDDLNLGYQNEALKANTVFNNEARQFNASADNNLAMQRDAAWNSERLQNLTDMNRMRMIELEGRIQKGITDAQLLSNQRIAEMNNATTLDREGMSNQSAENIARINGELDILNTQTKGQIDESLDVLLYAHEKEKLHIQGAINQALETTKHDSNLQTNMLNDIATIVSNSGPDELGPKLDAYFANTGKKNNFVTAISDEGSDGTSFDRYEQTPDDDDWSMFQ